MNKSKLISMLNKIEPDSKLLEETKANMEKLSSNNRKTYFKYYISSVAAIIIIALMGIYNNVYFGSMNVLRDFSIEKNHVSNDVSNNSRAISLDNEDGYDKNMFINNLNDKDLAVIIKGDVMSSSHYIDKNNKYDIDSFDSKKIKVTKILYDKGQSGIKEGQIINAIKYNMDLSFENESKDIYYLYKGKNNNPMDPISEAIGINDSWIIYK